MFSFSAAAPREQGSRLSILLEVLYHRSSGNTKTKTVGKTEFSDGQRRGSVSRLLLPDLEEFCQTDQEQGSGGAESEKRPDSKGIASLGIGGVGLPGGLVGLAGLIGLLCRLLGGLFRRLGGFFSGVSISLR